MIIIPAILEERGDDAIAQVNALRGFVPWVQLDFMDGTMTPHKTCDIKDLCGSGEDISIEVHLMTKNPEKYLEECAAIGAQRVYVHLEEVDDIDHVLRAMDPYDFSRGICLSPQTSVDDLFTIIDDIDAAQIMTVVPGQQGGQFLELMLEKIADVRERRTDLWISVDGGVSEKTIALVAEKSVDAMGVGSAISTAEDPVAAYEQLTHSLRL